MITDIEQWLESLNYTFGSKPLLIGGMAMEFYGLRQAGDDIDFVITNADYASLAAMYPADLRDIFGDLGVCVDRFEMWTTICTFSYDELAVDALESNKLRIVSLDKLLLLKALGMHMPKYAEDLRMVVAKLLDVRYGKSSLPSV